jgi:hypothetical protein
LIDREVFDPAKPMEEWMADEQDILELSGMRMNRAQSTGTADRAADLRRRSPGFLSVWFRCCHVYGRMLRNAEQTAYEGRCPKCGAAVRARIGANGTNQRMFEAK